MIRISNDGNTKPLQIERVVKNNKGRVVAKETLHLSGNAALDFIVDAKDTVTIKVAK